ncbi:MAG: zinc ribbon domain-containing protein [Betaproteobacteria bacterium]|nr:zinc ribbon domain-containing protein [Betaproteobacteria bacterium]
MPIYAYKCADCGFEKDVIQKFSDAPLSTCPACGAQAFSKQLTAPAFQLKGSGWYVTDFRDGGRKRPSPKRLRPRPIRAQMARSPKHRSLNRQHSKLCLRPVPESPLRRPQAAHRPLRQPQRAAEVGD